MLDGDQVSNWLNTISQGQNTTRRFTRHTCEKRGIADTVQLQLLLQSGPVESLLMNHQLIYSLFPSILWRNTKGILSVLHFTAGSVTLCQINRSLDPVIGHCFHVFINHLKRIRFPVLQSPFSEEVSKVIDTNSQAPIPVCAVLTCFQWVILIVQKRIKSHYSQAHRLLKILWFTDTSPIDSAESTKTNQSILIVELLQRNCRKLNLNTVPRQDAIKYPLISLRFIETVSVILSSGIFDGLNCNEAASIPVRNVPCENKAMGFQTQLHELQNTHPIYQKALHLPTLKDFIPTCTVICRHLVSAFLTAHGDFRLDTQSLQHKL